MYRLFIILAFASCLLTGCHHQYPQTLILADSLADVRPDRSLRLLESIASDMKSASEADRMYYRLLCLKAADKQGQLKPDTAEIAQLLDYFDDSSDSLRPTALYYAGRTYYDLQNMPQALDYFQQAVDAIGERKGKFLRLKKVCHSQMGYLFHYQKLYDEAQAQYLNSIECAQKLGDTLGLAFGYRDLAMIYNDKDSFEISMRMLKIAHEFVQGTPNTRVKLSIESYMANCYRHLGELDSALYHIQLVMGNVDVDKSAAYSNAAKIYYDRGEPDSAIYYYHLLEDVGGVYAKEKAYQYLLESSITMHEDNALQYFNNYMLFNDSVKRITQTEAVARTHALYNYQKKEKENLQLREANAYKMVWMAVILVSAAMAIMILMLYLQNYRRKQHILTERYKNLERIKNENYHKSEAFIEINKQKVKELTEKLSVAAKDNANLEAELERERERLLSATAVAEIGLKERAKAEEAVMNSPIYKLFIDKGAESSAEQLTSEDWRQLEKLLNREYDQFTIKLRSICKLSEMEYRVSLLQKAGIKPIMMSRLLHTSKENISTVRSRVYQKNFGRKGTAKDWDEFLKSF